MNKDEALHLFFNLFEGIDATDEMTTAFFDIISKTGHEEDIFRMLVLRLKILSDLGINATRHKEFENIGNGLFSMHLAGNGFNIRILYALQSNQQPVFLLTFYERGGKRRTDYSAQIPKALELLKKYKEEH